MPDLAHLSPAILAVHACLGVTLLMPFLVLPFTVRAREGGVDRCRRGAHRLRDERGAAAVVRR